MSLPINLSEQNTTLKGFAGFDVVLHPPTKFTIAFGILRNTHFAHLHQNPSALLDTVLIRLAHYHSMRMS